MADGDKLNVDSIISRLLEGKFTSLIYARNIANFYHAASLNHHLYVIVRGARPGKSVQLAEHEIRSLCIKSREMFLSQPILLELEAPLKICGNLISIL